MPTYKYNPNKEDPKGFFVSSFEVYDPITKEKDYKKIYYGQKFTTDCYLPQNIIEKEELEFISDEPYVSPIILSKAIYKDQIVNIDLSNIHEIIDLYISISPNCNPLESNAYANIWFNNDSDNIIDVNMFNSGTILKGLSLSNIRIITVHAVNCVANVSLIKSQFGSMSNG